MPIVQLYQTYVYWSKADCLTLYFFRYHWCYVTLVDEDSKYWWYHFNTLRIFQVPFHHHQEDRNHLHHCFCPMSMIIKVSTHLSSLMTVTTLTTMITAKNDHSKQRHCFCKFDHSAHQDDHHYTHDRGFCCYITIVAGGRRHRAVRKIAPAAPSVPLGLLPPSCHRPHTLGG